MRVPWKHAVPQAFAKLKRMQNDLFGLDQIQLLGRIRNYYWHLRTIRPGQQAKRRKLYRHIHKIKAVLLEDGFDPEELRLYCRHLASCNEAARGRYEAYLQKRDGETQKTHKA